MKSMTGFASIERQTEHYSIYMEIKAVNHRFKEILVKLPPRCSALEAPIRKAISKAAKRGHIEASLQLTMQQSASSAINLQLAESYIKAYESLKALSGDVKDEIDPILFLSLPGVFTPDAGSFDFESAWHELEGPIEEAVKAFDNERLREGEETAKDLKEKLDTIRRLAAFVEAETQDLPKAYIESLKKRIDLLGMAQIDDDRLITELILYADKCSVDEELTRLRLHFDNFEAEIASNEPVGRKLDFLIQEINREANTIASKSAAFTVAVSVAEIKSELEKMREQIQNIE